MRALVDHFMRSNRDYILRRSLKHIHLTDVHSIALGESANGSMIRMYVNLPSSALSVAHSQQKPGDIVSEIWPDGGVFPLAIHPHHCDLTLVGLSGEMRSYQYRPTWEKHAGQMLTTWSYKSAVNLGHTNVPQFDRLPEQTRLDVFDRFNVSEKKEPLRLPAQTLHTVVCEANRPSAWL